MLLLEHRLRGLVLVLLPIVAVLWRRGYPALIFPSAAIGAAILSAQASQQKLGSFYAGPVMVCLAAGLLEAAILDRKDAAKRGTPGVVPWLRAAMLAGVALHRSVYIPLRTRR